MHQNLNDAVPRFHPTYHMLTKASPMGYSHEFCFPHSSVVVCDILKKLIHMHKSFLMDDKNYLRSSKDYLNV